MVSFKVAAVMMTRVFFQMVCQYLLNLYVAVTLKHPKARIKKKKRLNSTTGYKKGTILILNYSNKNYLLNGKRKMM